MSRVFPRGPAQLAPNMTPLVDVVFLLIVFFVLVAQITSAERMKLLLPLIGQAELAAPPSERRAVVNIVPDSEPVAGAAAFRLGTSPVDGPSALAERLREAVRIEPNLRVIIRAARDEHYERVHDAMQACRAAGVRRVHLAAVEDRDG